MAERFDVAEKRMFDDVYICRKCNARNKTTNPEETRCRKCGYGNLRPKHAEIKE
ncbi:MAG: 50S ribosomal protein L40e [Candidatus Nanohaloarchaea archaeon]|nr:50S ribosomal protein L40e [Candidatus Nanohaloarchaea archaeon]